MVQVTPALSFTNKDSMCMFKKKKSMLNFVYESTVISPRHALGGPSAERVSNKNRWAPVATVIVEHNNSEVINGSS